MNFWKQLIWVLLNRPQQILVSLFWFIQGKKKRARNRLGLLETHSLNRFHAWQSIYERAVLSNIIEEEFREETSFLVCVSNYKSPYESKDTVISLNNQSYTNWSLYCEKDGNNYDVFSQFDFLIWVREGDTLPAYALKNLAGFIQDNSQFDIFYSDHDYLFQNGKRGFPYFKGDWNYALLLSSDYIFGLCAISTNSLSPLLAQFNIFSWTGRYQSLIALGLKKEVKARHITEILYHCHKTSNKFPEIGLLRAPDCGHGILYDIFDIEPQEPTRTLSFKHISLAIPKAEPKVTVVIPTKDSLDVLRPCLESLLTKTTYQNYNIIVIDNNSHRKETLQYLESISFENQIQVLQYLKSFNYAAINNYAVEQADGDFVCLVNNDTKIIEPMWLEHLLSWAARPNVGAVGAKLLYPDNRIQHAGVIIGLGGLAGHGHRFLRNSEPGYFYRAHLPQYISAVTGACLMVSKKKYLEIGGMDSDNFPVAFNDVDFCLKLDAAGYNNVYEPRAVLYHYESQSRGKDIRGEKRKRYLRECEMLQKRWSTDTVVDRYYSPHLATDREDFAIKITAESTERPG